MLCVCVCYRRLELICFVFEVDEIDRETKPQVDCRLISTGCFRSDYLSVRNESSVHAVNHAIREINSILNRSRFFGNPPIKSFLKNSPLWQNIHLLFIIPNNLERCDRPIVGQNVHNQILDIFTFRHFERQTKRNSLSKFVGARKKNSAKKSWSNSPTYLIGLPFQVSLKRNPIRNRCKTRFSRSALYELVCCN